MKKQTRWIPFGFVMLVVCSVMITGGRAERAFTDGAISQPDSRLAKVFKPELDPLMAQLFVVGQGKAGPTAAGDITVKSAYDTIAGNQTFTLVKEFFTSSNCSTGSSGQTQDTGVNSSTGVTFAKPASANSVKLYAPDQDPADPIQKSDQNSVWTSWTSATTFTHDPMHFQDICVAYSDVGGGTATFTAHFNPGVITRAASGGVCGAATPKTLFDVGEQVCVEFFFNPASVTGGALHSVVQSDNYPTNCNRDIGTNVSTDTGTYVFTLPSTDTTPNVCGAGIVVDNRGTWNLQALDTSNSNRASMQFRVHDSAAGHEATDLLINKNPTSGSTVNCGSNITWSITIQNRGPDPAQNATLIDPLPKDALFQSISAPGWTCITPAVGSSGLISCTNPSLPAGAIGSNLTVSTITVVAQAATGLPNNTSITNAAVVGSKTFDLDPGNTSQPTGALVQTASSCTGNGPLIGPSTGTQPNIVTESCSSANLAPDPRETVTMQFCLQNFGNFGFDTVHIKGTLQATGGVTNPSGQVQIGDGALHAVGNNGPEQCANFSFKVADVACGSRILASIDLVDDNHLTGGGLGTAQFTIQVGTGNSGQNKVCCTSSPTAAPGSISGVMTDTFGSPLGGVTVHLDGEISRTTVTDASGVYYFNNLETSQFYTVTPSLANYSFSPVNRSFSLVGDTTDAAFTGTADASQTANAVDTTEYFVRQHYLDFLGREPDQGGFEYWTGQINQCNGDANCVRNKRIDVSASFFASPEFQQTGSFIYELYAGALGRTPDYNEFMPDRSQVIGGPNLDAARVAFTDAFVQRPEFTAKYPLTLTRDQFVDALLQTMTTRSGADVSSLRDTMLSDYDTGGRSLAVRDAVQASAFVQAEYNKAFVLFEYFGYLRRNPDTGGYDFWLDVLNGREAGNYRGMVCAFLTSSEYQLRFSSVVTRSNAECGR